MAEKLYDLSVPVGYMTPDWMGHPPATDRFLERVQRHEVPIAPGVSRRVSALIAATWHKGTHVDVQGHHIEGGVQTDKMPLESFNWASMILSSSKPISSGVHQRHISTSSPQPPPYWPSGS